MEQASGESLMPIRIIDDAPSLYSLQSSYDNSVLTADQYTYQFLSRPDIASNISSIQSVYPHLTPGATLSLAQGGYDGYSPLTATTALAAANRRAKKGFGWHTIGDVIGGGLVSLGKAIDWATEPAQATLKPIARTTFAAFNYGANMLDVQLGQAAANIRDRGLPGAVKSAAEFAFPISRLADPSTLKSQLGQTQIGAALESQFSGQDMGLGAGYFPAGPSTDLAAERRRSVYEIDGHAPTMGRLLAQVVYEPGSSQYNRLSGVLDAAKLWYADPANAALGGISRARAASKLLIPGTTDPAQLARQISKVELAATPEDAGLISALRRTVHDPTARAWATLHPQGRTAIDYFTAQTSPYKIWRDTGVDLEVAADLARTRTTTETMNVFDNAFLTMKLREKPGLPNPLKATTRRTQDNVRLLATYPRDQVARSEHLTETAEKVRAHMINGRMGGDAIAQGIDQLALVPPQERPAVIRDIFNDIANRLAGQVQDDGTVLGAGKLKIGDKVYVGDRSGRGQVVGFFDTTVSGAAEGGGGTYRQASARVRFSSGGVDEIVERPLYDLSKHLSFTQARAILRPRGLEEGEVFIRELAEGRPVLGAVLDGTLETLPPAHQYAELASSEHLLLPNIRAARKYFSRFGRTLNNPTLAAGTEALDRFRDIWLPATLLRPAGSLRSLGAEAAYLAAAGQTSLFRHPFTHIAVILGRKQNVTFTGDPFEEAERVSQVAAHAGRGWLDRETTAASQMFRPSDPAFPTKWADRLARLSTDPLARRVSGYFDEGEAVTGNVLADAKSYFWNKRIPELRQQLDEKAWPKYYQSRALADEYVDKMASQLQHLTNSDPILSSVVGTGLINGERAFSGNALAPELLNYTRDLSLAGQAPKWVIAERSPDKGVYNALNSYVTKMFDGLWSYPMKKLTLIPTLKNFYWQRGEEILPLLTREAQEQLLKEAKESGLARSRLRGMAGSMLKGNGDLTLDEASAVAMDFAISESKKLLYDLHDRSQFGDIIRHFVPFFDAWKYNLDQAARLTYRRPEVTRRFQMTVEGARGSGFFQQDDSGNEVFSYFLPESVLPGKIGLTGRVAGLNLATSSLIPGLGPLVQIPVNKLLPDTPDAKYIRGMLLPFGEPPDLSGSLTPPWLDKIIMGVTGTPDGQRQFANNVKDASRYLMSTGQHDLSTEAGSRVLEDKSLGLAKVVTVLQGLAQSLLPASPKVSWKAYDPDGRLLAQAKMGAELQRMRDDPAIGWDNAVANFLNTFGEQNILMLQPNTVGTSPASKSALDWSMLHRDIINDYPDAAQYIAPQGGGPAGIQGYAFAMAEGMREPLPYKDWIARANDRVGSMIYYNQKDKFGTNPTRPQQDYLRQLNSFLKQKFPGYDPESADPNKSKRTIEQLYSLAESRPELLSATSAGKAILTYLRARDQAADSARAMKIAGWQTAKKTEPQRAYLRGLAQRLTTEAPDFTLVWDRVFARETQAQAASSPATRSRLSSRAGRLSSRSRLTVEQGVS